MAMADALPSSGSDPSVDALLDRARIPTTIKAAAITLALAGLMCAIWGVQNVTLVRWVGLYAVGPWALMVLGAAGIGVSAKLVRARRWALGAGIASAVALLVTSLVFFILSGLSGVYTMLSVMGAAASISAVIFTVLAAGPFRELMETRRRLRDAGYDLDL
jgi:FtsH-binding integral membrane protein